MAKVNFHLGIEFGYDQAVIEVEELVRGTNGMAIIKIPPGYQQEDWMEDQDVILEDGSAIMPCGTDWLTPIA